MPSPVQERAHLIEKACKSLWDEVEEVVSSISKFEHPPKLKDDYDKLHLQLLFFSTIEGELSHLYRQGLRIKEQVELSLKQATEILKDAEVQAVEAPGFKLTNTYTSRVETEARLRSKTFEEIYEVRIWEKLKVQVQYLMEVIKSYQMDAFKNRKDIDTRIKLKDLQI